MSSNRPNFKSVTRCILDDMWISSNSTRCILDDVWKSSDSTRCILDDVWKSSNGTRCFQDEVRKLSNGTRCENRDSGGHLRILEIFEWQRRYIHFIRLYWVINIILRCCWVQPLLYCPRPEDACRVICSLSVDSFNQHPMRQAHRAHGAQLIFFADVGV